MQIQAAGRRGKWAGKPGLDSHSSSHVEQLAEDAALRGVRPTEADVGETFREVHRPVGHGKGKNAPDSSDSGKGQESGQHRQVTPHAGLCPNFLLAFPVLGPRLLWGPRIQAHRSDSFLGAVCVLRLLGMGPQ